jgi:hypothetical protein
MSIWEQLGEMMVAVTFAEADEAETAREIMKSAESRKVRGRSAARQWLRSEKHPEDAKHVLQQARRKKQ